MDAPTHNAQAVVEISSSVNNECSAQEVTACAGHFLSYPFQHEGRFLDRTVNVEFLRHVWLVGLSWIRRADRIVAAKRIANFLSSVIVVSLIDVQRRELQITASPACSRGMLEFTVPDRRFRNRASKKSCRCTHGVSIHHKKIPGAVKHPCWYPGCDCKDYRPVKK